MAYFIGAGESSRLVGPSLIPWSQLAQKSIEFRWWIIWIYYETEGHPLNVLLLYFIGFVLEVLFYYMALG